MKTLREAAEQALEALEDMLGWESLAPQSVQDSSKQSLQRLREALAQPAPEPVACVQDLDEVKRKHLVYENGMGWKDPLYTSPPRRQPLTDKTLWGMWVESPSDVLRFARAIEEAHGIGGEE